MISKPQPICPSDLIGWRKRNGISLPAIAATTKISLRYLEAIEAGQFQRLPGGAYTISYLRQYAQAIHYDVNDLVESYRALLKSEAAAEPAPPHRDTWAGRVWDYLRALGALALYGEIPHP